MGKTILLILALLGIAAQYTWPQNPVAEYGHYLYSPTNYCHQLKRRIGTQDYVFHPEFETWKSRCLKPAQ